MSGLTAENLAEATADGAFSEFDAHHKNYLTFQEFQKWHDSSRGTMESEVAKSTAETMTLGELKRLSGLGNLTVNETLARFRKFCKHDYVTRQEFYMCLRDIAKDIEMTHDEEDRLVLCLEGLYDLFDKNGDSKVSKKELVSGLVILCSDDKHDKARTSFKLFDLNGDSAIDIQEMTAYLKSVFQIVYHTDPRMEIEMECDAETLARRTYFVLCCFHSLTHLLTRSINLSIIRYGRARIRGGRS
jgi:Ca2+-binding EF-hand superfamily protein